ncbi:MAG: flavodoxin family protein [Erysipelotrichaceae bacterium]
MKYAILYSSKTGNTKKVAEAIKLALKNHECIACDDKFSIECLNADIIFLGSWTDKGTCSDEMKQFYAKLSNQKIALFGTAGFGGNKEYYENLAKRSIQLLPETCHVLGSFYCQGKMPDVVKNRYVAMLREHPDDTNLQVSIENFEQAKNHPDQEDIKKAQMFAFKMIELR